MQSIDTAALARELLEIATALERLVDSDHLYGPDARDHRNMERRLDEIHRLLHPKPTTNGA